MDEVYMTPEINELLKQNYAFISGGHDPKGNLLITFPDGKVETSLTEAQHKTLLSYLVNAASDKDSRTKFAVVIDRRNSNWSVVKGLLHCIFDLYPGTELLEDVYLLSPSGLFQNLNKLFFHQSNSVYQNQKLCTLYTLTELYKYVNPSQLTHDFGGELYYNNNDWMKHRQLVELLSQSFCQLNEDLKAGTVRMVSGNQGEMTAGQIKGEIETLDRGLEQFKQRVEKSLAEAGAEIVQLKTINGETLSSADIPPSSARHVSLVERVVAEIDASLSIYVSQHDKHKTTLERCFRARQFEEENNRWCAILDEHLLFLMNFNPLRDTVEEIKNCLSELEKFNTVAKDDFCKGEEFYRTYQNFLAEDSDESLGLSVNHDLNVNEEEKDEDDDESGKSLTHDNRIEVSCIHYNEQLSLYHDQLQCGLELHSHIEQTSKWQREGTEYLAKNLPTPDAKKSVYEEEFDDIDIFISSVSFQSLTDNKYIDVMTPSVKATVDDLIVKLENILSSCRERRQQLRQLVENHEKMQLKSCVISLESSASSDVFSASFSETTNALMPTEEVICDSPTSTTSSSSSLMSSEGLINNIDRLYLSTKMNREFSQLKPVMPTGTIRRKRGHVIQELIATERIYTSELLSIIEGYLQQFDNPELAHLIPEDLKQKHRILFGNIEDIHKFHAEIFLNCLENCEPTLVGKCFTDHKTKFEMYGIYCQNKMQAEHLIERMGNYPFFQVCQKRLGHRLPLSSYILKPIQRITKYHLLLRELIKMATSQQEKDDLSEAVESMRDVVKYVNNILHQVSITGFPGDLADQGRLLMQGSVDVWVGRRRDKKPDVRSKGHRRHAFLYEKLFIFCKRKEDQQPSEREIYFYKNSLSMSDIGLTEAPKGSDERRFEIWGQGRTDIWTILAPNEEAKEDWVKEIKRVLFNQYVHHREASRKSVIERQGTSDSAQQKFISISEA